MIDESTPTIEMQVIELKEAGWKAKTNTLWRAPWGALYLGPHGAWKIMKAARGERQPSRVSTELDALLERVREMRTNPAYPDRNAVAYDCYRMFEDLATRFKEESAMRDRYKRQSDSWRDKALDLSALLSDVAKIDDGDEPLAWKHAELFKRIHAEVKGE